MSIEKAPHASPPSVPASPGRGYETRDTNNRFIWWSGLVLVALVGVSSLLMVFLFDFFAEREARRQKPLSPVAAAVTRQRPPEPRLQANPVADYKAVREAEEIEIHNYAFIDAKAGIVRLPIETAMDLLAARGIPASSAGDPNTAIPSEAAAPAQVGAPPAGGHR